MQYLQEALNSIKNITNNKSNLDTLKLLKDIKTNSKTNYPQKDKIEGLIQKYDKKVKHVNDLAKLYNWKEEKIEEKVRDTRDSVISRIANLTITEETMYYLIKDAIIIPEIEDKEKQSDSKKCKRKMLNILYNTHKKLFLSIWK